MRKNYWCCTDKDFEHKKSSKLQKVISILIRLMSWAGKRSTLFYLNLLFLPYCLKAPKSILQKHPYEWCVSNAVQSMTSVRACALPLLCKRAAVCRQAAMHLRAEGVSTCCHRRGGAGPRRRSWEYLRRQVENWQEKEENMCLRWKQSQAGFNISGGLLTSVLLVRV